ncbi:MAG: hypothetical protein JWL59_3012 [Chthoniobacteraceae bacterium]|nr:hypothetical protein [Chthoniobacteraceae bacterium]
MKKLPLLLLTSILAIGCGAAALLQMRANAVLQASALRLNQTVEEQAAELGKLQAEQEKVRSQSEAFQAESQELRKLLAAKNVPAANVASNPVEEGVNAGAKEGKPEEGGFMKKMAKMYDDPAMKKVMRTQQLMGIKMLYADLGKELGLSSEDASQLMELLADRQVDISAKSLAILGEGGDAKSVTASKEEHDQQIKGLIGEDRMKKLTEYEAGIGDRMQMQQVQQSLTSSGMPLDEKQRASLLSIMKEERLVTPPNPFTANAQNPTAQIKAMQSGEGVDQFVKSTEDFNQRVSRRARGVLNPDQINSFDATQKQQLEMIQMSMKFMKQK